MAKAFFIRKNALAFELNKTNDIFFLINSSLSELSVEL
jgi:hypothetical protein